MILNSLSQAYKILLKKLVEPSRIEKWAVVNFSARCDIRNLVQNLTKCAEMKGIVSFMILC